MLKHRTEWRSEAPVASVFAAALRVLAAGRWDGALEAASDALPRPGCRYSVRCGDGQRSGQVIECLRPVSLLLQESLVVSRRHVRLVIRLAVTTAADMSLLRLEIRAELGTIAFFGRRRWRRRLAGECEEALAAIVRELARGVAQPAGVSGQSRGRSSIVVAKTTSVSGMPSLR